MAIVDVSFFFSCFLGAGEDHVFHQKVRMRLSIFMTWAHLPSQQAAPAFFEAKHLVHHNYSPSNGRDVDNRIRGRHLAGLTLDRQMEVETRSAGTLQVGRLTLQLSNYNLL